MPRAEANRDRLSRDTAPPVVVLSEAPRRTLRAPNAWRAVKDLLAPRRGSRAAPAPRLRPLDSSNAAGTSLRAGARRSGSLGTTTGVALRMANAGGDRAGFTVLETLVALLILGLALTPLLTSVSAGARAQGSLGATHEAVALAESRMAELALVPMDSIAFYRVPRTGWFPRPFSDYRWRALLRADPATPALVRGAVLVEWKRGSYTLETVFHRPDLLPDFAPAQ